MSLLLAGWAWPVTKDLSGCQWPVAQHPADAAVPQFAGRFGWRDGQDGHWAWLGQYRVTLEDGIQLTARWRPAPTSSTSAGWQARLTSTRPAGPRSTQGSTIGSSGISPHTATSASLSLWQARFRTASRNGPAVRRPARPAWVGPLADRGAARGPTRERLSGKVRPHRPERGHRPDADLRRTAPALCVDFWAGGSFPGTVRGP